MTRRPRAARLRLLVTTPHFLPHTGGVETHVLETSRRLAARGVDVTVLTTQPGGAPARETMDGVEVRRLAPWPRRGDLRLAPGLDRALADEQWDLVHVQSYHTLLAPQAMAWALRRHVPYVLTFHAGGHSARVRGAVRPVQQRALGPLVRRARAVVALTPAEITRYGPMLGVPRTRFRLIPNGADLPLAHARGVGTDPDLIVSVGRLERYKGHHLILAALPAVLRRRPGARLWIAGAGPHEPALRRLAAELGVAPRVEIRAVPPADRARMAAELARAGLVVLLSEFETHPIAALEALALGRRLLVADAPGLRELTATAPVGVVPLGLDPEALADAVVARMDAPEPEPVPLPTWDDCARGLHTLYSDLVPLAACAS